MTNLTNQIQSLNLDDHFKWEEETETVTIYLKGYDIVCRAECTFHFEAGELNRGGYSKLVFSHLDSKQITVLGIYSDEICNREEIQQLLNDKL